MSVKELFTPGSSSHRFIISFQDTNEILLVDVRDNMLIGWPSSRMRAITNVNDIPALMNDDTRACFGVLIVTGALEGFSHCRILGSVERIPRFSADIVSVQLRDRGRVLLFCNGWLC